MKQQQSGFTLIEIAIVLVIIGLLLGGILKGQELINSARVRNVISQQDGIKAAYFGFQDRYRAIPGDYTGPQALANIPGIANATVGGNGNGAIADVGGNTETVLAWTHLARSGFITGPYNATTATPARTTDNMPTNPYNALIEIAFDNAYQGAGAPRVNIKTGNQLLVEILAEIDRKVDDSQATAGNFRFSAYNGGAAAPTLADCVTVNNWNVAGGSANCGAAGLF